MHVRITNAAREPIASDSQHSLSASGFRMSVPLRNHQVCARALWPRTDQVSECQRGMCSPWVSRSVQAGWSIGALRCEIRRRLSWRPRSNLQMGESSHSLASAKSADRQSLTKYGRASFFCTTDTLPRLAKMHPLCCHLFPPPRALAGWQFLAGAIYGLDLPMRGLPLSGLDSYILIASAPCQCLPTSLCWAVHGAVADGRKNVTFGNE